MLWTCSRDGHSGTLQGHWHWVDCRRAAFVRFWVADRSDSWSVLAFGAKWIISGRQPVRCGRPACITNAYLWHNLQLVHRLEDYRGTPIINLEREPGRHNRALTNILVHSHRVLGRRCHGTPTVRHTLHGYRRPVKRCEQPDRFVATRIRGRGRTGRSEGSPTGLTPGSAHCTGKPRGSGWDSGRTKLPNPRAPPMPSDADRGGGWERVHRHRRAEGSFGPPPWGRA